MLLWLSLPTKKIKVKVNLNIILLLLVLLSASQSVAGPPVRLPPAQILPWQTGFRTPWVDSVLATLSLEERIAQLFMIEVRPTPDARYFN